MFYKSPFLLVAISICFVTKSFSQHGHYDITNGISLHGGITKFNILTDNFNTTEGNGFIGGFMATVDIPSQWYNISFGLQYAESPLKISGRPTQLAAAEESIDYNIFTVQLAMLGHIKVIEDYFTIDLGPMLQYNSRLELKDKNQESYFINNYDNLMASDISNISQFNFNGIVGATAGIKHLKLKAQYIYGFTNILKKLESQNLDTSGGNARFKGNQTMLVFGVMVSF